MLSLPMTTFINPTAADWLTIAKAAHRGQAEASPGYARVLARRLAEKHGVAGVEVHVEDGVISVSHPGGIPGLEDGWEQLGEHP